ncbi:MAG TPA: RimK family alpha-L-glutamate ligase [Xanthobacteraceae bacterium]|nr:RimK family alpha-L-glutamate ligase [Xanthobacteraceae bacterium]
MPRSADRLTAAPDAAPPRVAIVGDRVDWHAKELTRALAAAGARAVPIRLERCEFATTQASGLRIDGFADRLPDAVIVRAMSGGTFEAVTRRLGILHALRDLGVTVWNDARAIERCVDKSMTSFLLARAGIATPPTWTVESPEAARAIVAREAGPLVLKPLFGSQGRGLRLIREAHDLPAPDGTAGVYYLQRFVGVEREGFRDFRLLVSQGRVIAAMARHAASWITNVKQGGRPVAAVADGGMKDLGIGAAAAVGANFAGVDLVHGADGRPAVLEVNSMPAWSGLQKVTSADIAALLVADLMAALDRRAGAAV